MTTQFDENRKSVFSKKLRSLMEGYKKTHEKFTQGDLASAINASREAVVGWFNEKFYPSDTYISALCEFFGVPPTYFEPEEGELIFTDEQRHRDLEALCRRNADYVGLSVSLLQFIKERPGLADLVISASWVNPVVNPPDSKVPNTDSPFQFESSSGVRIYLPDEVIYMLRLVQRDLEEYAGFLIRKYSQTISDYRRPSAGQDRPQQSPLTSFSLDLEGASGLTPDEYSVVSMVRLMDEKGRIELAKQAAHIVHRQRKQSRIPDIDAMIAEEGGEK